MSMKIIFSHGRSGRPDGHKIQMLAQIAHDLGCNTDSIDYTDTQDPDVRAERLANIVKQQATPFVLVGSSMGGYASLVAAESADKALLRGVFLMAPGLYLPRYQQQQFITDIANTEIVHGWDDTVVLYEHSVRYARAADCPLHLLPDNHRLSRNPERVGEVFSLFLQRIISE